MISLKPAIFRHSTSGYCSRISWGICFADSATEGRCLSFSPDETTREDIPPELPSRYADEVAELRALIARFTLEHWSEVSEDCMLSCNGMGIEGRLKQMARPLSVILTLFPDGQERFLEYLNARQKEIRQTRAESYEGGMFNYALSLAQGEEDLMTDPEFGKYYHGGEIQVILPGMIAEGMRCSSRTVTRALGGIDMEVRQKRISTTKGTKNVRALFVPNRKKWLEIMQRYYFDESGGEIPECPECLRGPEYHSRQSGISNTGMSPDGTDNTILQTDKQLNESSRPALATLPEWLSYHGFDPELPVEKYATIPKESRIDLFCRCKMCTKPDRMLPLYWIPERPYNQICQIHYNEMKALCEKEMNG